MVSDHDEAGEGVYDRYSPDVQVLFKGAAAEAVPQEVSSRINDALAAFEKALGDCGGACRVVLTVEVPQALNLVRRG
jgi:hypothetical protein